MPSLGWQSASPGGLQGLQEVVLKVTGIWARAEPHAFAPSAAVPAPSIGPNGTLGLSELHQSWVRVLSAAVCLAEA